MFKELEIVRLTHDTLCDDGKTTLRMGMLATIVHVLSGPATLGTVAGSAGTGYILEFANPENSLATVTEASLLHAGMPLKLLVETSKPMHHFWGARILFWVWPGDGPIVEAARRGVDQWCSEHWPEDIPNHEWERDKGQILVRREAMAVEFKMRWHNTDVNALFEA